MRTQDQLIINYLDTREMVYRVLGQGPAMIGIGSYPKPDPDRWKIEFPFQKEYSAVYLLRGSGTYRDTAGNRFRLEAGTVFHRLPGVHHWSEPDSGGQWLEMFIHLPATVWEGLRAGGLFENGPEPWRIGFDADILQRMIRMRQLLTKAEGYEVLGIALQIEALLLDMKLRSTDSSGKEEKGLLELACSGLRRDLSSSLDLPSLARELGLKYDAFRRWFRSSTGLSPGAYRNRARFEQACQLLLSTDMDLSMIARELGFTDAYSFSRQFKKYAGLAPSNYRRQRG
ncbi:MAG: helix-turn-helix domain-containing protein [Planctomycetes bacterium]|nr:helix-turn-helix domain-containing protein [Planctomycetota bacterium]